MDDRGKGRIKLRYFPILRVEVNNTAVSTANGQIASAGRIDIDPHLRGLMHLKVHLENLHIHDPHLTFDPDAFVKILAFAEGILNDPMPLESLIIDSFSISQAKFFYADQHWIADVNALNVDSGRIDIIKNRKIIIDDLFSFLQAVKFKGDIAAKQIILPSLDIKMENIRVNLNAENGILTADPIELDYFSAPTLIAAVFNMQNNRNHLKIQLKIPAVDLDSFLEGSPESGIAQGVVKVKADF